MSHLAMNLSQDGSFWSQLISMNFWLKLYSIDIICNIAAKEGDVPPPSAESALVWSPDQLDFGVQGTLYSIQYYHTDE